MGRRSINTTKSGKYMNPTDQHRKEARKRELRKNKKQRLIVRTAVLKGKDPFQIIADLERLDQMEYNVTTPPPLNEKVLKDKRRKMKETWDRLLRLYCKDDQQRFVELKRMEAEYESKRNQMIKFYESVKSAQEVSIDDIPLPSAPMEPSLATTSVPMTSIEPMLPQSILKRSNVLTMQSVHKTPPGVPPGPPPVFSDYEDNDDDDDIESEDEMDNNKRIRFSDEMQTNEKDSEVNDFLKELEQIEKPVNNSDSVSQTIQSIQSLPAMVAHQTQGAAIPPPPSLLTNVTSAPPQPRMFAPLFRPPIPHPSAQPPNMTGLLVNKPHMSAPMPGPPLANSMRPGLPPRMINSRPVMQPMRPMPVQTTPFPSAPMTTKRDDKKTHIVSDRATIEAKPQLRNLSADATRFTPVALRVKRDDKHFKKPNPKIGFSEMKKYSSISDKTGLNAPTKGDAYDQFMKEMENLL
ncbi:WW domain-binding protein 11-like [Oppia nitens]|uniref:WW domain-binding protein 11-like n=1 Tax=Oppia nitens TaxID=1686743 RepID=UPI0023D98507|nr:WW domain-binding protein 11-like [Oppia nitens]